MKTSVFYLSVLLCCTAGLAERSAAQQIHSLAPSVRKYVSVSTDRVVLEHIQIVDGTGAPPLADRNIYIENGEIAAISAGKDESPSAEATILNLKGDSVMPGIVGMHDHLDALAFPNLRR